MKSIFSSALLSIEVEGRRAFFLTVLILVLQVLLVLPAFFTGWIIDAIVSGSYEAVYAYFIYFFLLIVIVLFLSPLKSWVSASFAQRATREQSLRWTDKMLRQPLAKITGQGIGKIHVAIERASLSFETVITFLFGQWVPAIIEFFVVFVAFIFVIGVIPSILCLVFGLAYFVISFFFQRWKRSYVAQVNDAEDDLAEGFVNVFSKVRTIKAYRALNEAQEMMRVAFSNYAKHAERLGLVSGIISTGQAGYISLGMFFILLFGSFSLQQELGWFTVGQFVTSLTLFGMLSASMGKLSGVLAQAVDFEEDVRTLNGIMSEDGLPSLHQEKVINNKGLLILKKGDSLSLPNGEVVVESDLRIKSGDRILISGDSGSGKSTLLTFISDKLGGDLCVYEVQDSEFIEESSLLGVSSIDAKIIDQLGLPKKDSLDLNEGSGGERKRYGIARAVNTGRTVQIYDEPTSGLDSSLKGKVWDALASDKEKCIIVSSHDPVPNGWDTKKYTISNGKLSSSNIP